LIDRSSVVARVIDGLVIRTPAGVDLADIVEFAGSAGRIEATAEASDVEELPADLRPQDPD
jgi:hypothetical protein